MWQSWTTLRAMLNAGAKAELATDPAKRALTKPETLWEIEQGRGLHAKEGRVECAECHPEHAGRDFELVDWGVERDAFDHARAGWVLSGAHAQLKCEQCHQEKKLLETDAKFHNSTPANCIEGALKVTLIGL